MLVVHADLFDSPDLANTDPNAVECSEYTEPELEYALFLHAINMFYHLVCHSSSRALFFSDGNEGFAAPGSISSLVGMMVDYLRNCNPVAQGKDSGTTPFDMVVLCLMELAKHPRYGASCFGRDIENSIDQLAEKSQPINILSLGLMELFPVKPTASLNMADPVRLSKAVAYTDIFRNLVSHSEGRTLLHKFGALTDTNERFIDRLQTIVRYVIKSADELSSRSEVAEFATSLIDLCGLLNTLSSHDSLSGVLPIYHLTVRTFKTLVNLFLRFQSSFSMCL
ncbi:unnamed protein product [Echinostoma caproni]|uniref:Ufd2P_core domain-containing protein n=1 Tax=Echinostoma caproni TaxID=27848 RepID=A0A183A731_9TREM|nr:unnamed protein product [Echinostoma caproni]